MQRIKCCIEPFSNIFLLDPSHSIQNDLSLSPISNMQKLFGWKNDFNLECNVLKFNTPMIYITVIAWLVGGLLMAKLCYHVLKLRFKFMLPISGGPTKKCRPRTLRMWFGNSRFFYGGIFSLAWWYDIQDLKISFNSEFIEVIEKIDFFCDSLFNTAKTLKTCKERNEIYIFNIMSYINLIK